MNKRRIEKVLTEKLKAFVKTIKDDRVRRLVNQNSIITGGSIVSLLQSERVNDFDYYFTNMETCKAVAEYYVAEYIKDNPTKKTPEVIIEGESGAVVVDGLSDIKLVKPNQRVTIKAKSAKANGSFVYYSSEEQAEDVVEVTSGDSEGTYKPVYLSSNAITLSDDVQLIIRFYGDAEEIHKNYDFVHCTNYWTSSDKLLYLNKEALESIVTKELKYMGSRYPLASIIRTRKFIQRGWNINAGQFLKMGFQLHTHDLKNIESLQEQLAGVDSAYFAKMIINLMEKQDENSDFKLDSFSLNSAVDKIF